MTELKTRGTNKVWCYSAENIGIFFKQIVFKHLYYTLTLKRDISSLHFRPLKTTDVRTYTRSQSDCPASTPLPEGHTEKHFELGIGASCQRKCPVRVRWCGARGSRGCRKGAKGDYPAMLGKLRSTNYYSPSMPRCTRYCRAANWWPPNAVRR